MIEKILDNLNTDEYDFNYIIGETELRNRILVPKDKSGTPLFIWKNEKGLATGIRIDKPEYFLSGDEYRSLKEGDIKDLIKFLQDESDYGGSNFDFIRYLINIIGNWNIENEMPDYNNLPEYKRYYRKKRVTGSIRTIDKES